MRLVGMCKTLMCDTYAKISVRGKGTGGCTGTKSYHEFDSSQLELFIEHVQWTVLCKCQYNISARLVINCQISLLMHWRNNNCLESSMFARASLFYQQQYWLCSSDVSISSEFQYKRCRLSTTYSCIVNSLLINCADK